MKGRVVVAGATGFVGQRLLPALVAEGYDVVGGSRNPGAARRRQPDIRWVHFEVADERCMENALYGADTLIYLVHGMSSHADDLFEDERRAAQRVLRVAEASGLRRIVYLGAPQPKGRASKHLRARLETGHILRSGRVSTVELQAAMIIGRGSQSWLIVRDLALRLPLMILPQWLSRVSQPVGVADVVRALCRSIAMEGHESICLPLPGPETLTAQAILLRIAALRGSRPLMVPVPVLTPSLSSHWIRLVTRSDYKIARQLVDGLTSDLVCCDKNFWNHVDDMVPTPLDQVMQAALDEENDETLPKWQRRWESLVQGLSRRAARRE